MKISSIILAALIIMGTASQALASGQGPNGESGGRGPGGGPPPEAYTACEGKSAGDSVEIQTPHGDTITGTCEDNNGRLVLRPDNPPPDRQ